MTGTMLTETLEALEAERVPTDVDLRARVLAAARTVERRARRGTSRRTLGAAFAVGAAVLLAVSTTAYARGPVYESLIRLFAPEAPAAVPRAGQGQALGLSRTIDGVTLALDWAYADPERVLVAYSVRSADGRRYDGRFASLADSAGTSLPFIRGYGVTGSSDLLDVSLPAGEGAYVLECDARGLAARPGDTLSLRLEMLAEELPGGQAAPAPDAADQPATGRASGSASVALAPLPAGARVGPFAFAWSMPVAEPPH